MSDPSPADAARAAAVYQFARLQLPRVAVPEGAYLAHLGRAFGLFAPKAEPQPLTWPAFLDGLYAADLLVCGGCLDGLQVAWEELFAVRTGRSDALLVDALRARAARLYPRNEEKQESAVDEFWSQLLVPEVEGRPPVLARYDGQRPLAPWLIRVFQNLHLSRLRKHDPATALPDDDLAVPLPTPQRADARWHERFVAAARDWLAETTDAERLLLGLRWRYRLSQREVSHLLHVHEGTISRQTDKLRDHALAVIGAKLTAEGWTGDDLAELVGSEMGAVLLDDPRLSADQLARLVAAKGINL
jgi:RNA polymerase sigma factor (sigma-70 family)